MERKGQKEGRVDAFDAIFELLLDLDDFIMNLSEGEDGNGKNFGPKV